MKSIYKYLLLLMVVAMGGVLFSCSEDSTEGLPIISYIRVTSPESSDSLIVSAGQGKMVVIVGENLENVKEVLFNDRLAAIKATFITSTNVFVVIPTELPSVINNKLTMKFTNGDSLVHDFTVDISKPRIDRIKSEFLKAGDEAVIYGDYFYPPISVTFGGGKVGEVLTLSDKELHVIVPEGVERGAITLTTNFGETPSDVFFNDDRYIIAGFDIPLVDGFWRGADFVVSSDPDVSGVNGNFMRIAQGAKGAWPYFEVYGGPADGGANVDTRNLPADALTDPDNFSLKFEINTQQSFVGATLRLYIGNSGSTGFGDARNNTYYEWNSNENTNKEWQTVTIPWADVYEQNKRFSYNATGYGIYMYFHGPNAAIYDFALDNMRVVPNISAE